MLVHELQLIRESLDSRIRTGKLSVENPSDQELVLVPQVEDSFAIQITFSAPDDIKVSLDPWHEHVSSVEQATNLAIWLLTPYYRVVAMYAGGRAVRTHLEIFRNEGWDDMLGIYFMNPEEGLPEPDEIRIRQQAVFLDSNFLTYYPQAELDAAGYPVGTLLGETIYQQRSGEWHPTNVPDLPQN
jgi:hypothetical protein